MRPILLVLALAGVSGFQATTWGGDHIEMTLSSKGAAIEFDCAHGTIDEAVRPDAAGAFQATGTFVPERRGPSRDDGPPPLKATYSGSITDGAMSLTVVVEGQDPKGTAYQLTRDQRGNVRKCR